MNERRIPSGLITTVLETIRLDLAARNLDQRDVVVVPSVLIRQLRSDAYVVSEYLVIWP